MPMPANDVQRMIEEAITGSVVEIKDLAGDQDHYAAYITSEAFRGKSRIQQHQMVYQALGNRMGEELHALSLHTKTPD